MGDPTEPFRTVCTDSVYVPGLTVTVSPGRATLSPSCTRPNGAVLVPFPLPPGATNHSVACEGSASSHMAAAKMQTFRFRGFIPSALGCVLNVVGCRRMRDLSAYSSYVKPGRGA